tara:strand:- start:209 stop:1603 length:1395 start_codon:yes stop_codon:yes gene_type:complete
MINEYLNVKRTPIYIPNPYESQYQKNQVLDISLAKESFNFSPKFSINEGIETYLKKLSKKIKEPTKIHDFAMKLKDPEVIGYFKKYLKSQKENTLGDENTSPISINLDLTTGCNYRCPHCVDFEMIQKCKVLPYDEIISIIDNLVDAGLKSVILLGGGEPTLHPRFGEIVQYLKKKKLQIGLVSNGSRMEKIIEVADLFEKPDWVRFSIDSSSDELYRLKHGIEEDSSLPSLTEILEKARELKKANNNLNMGYSFVISWRDSDSPLGNGKRILGNIHEISSAALNAKNYGFDYISLKPCLDKTSENPIETLFNDEQNKTINSAIAPINEQITNAEKLVGEDLKIILSTNLKGLLSGTLEKLRNQPKTCHMGYFRQVVSPIGIYHCPAFRGDSRAKIGDVSLYSDKSLFVNAGKKIFENLSKFNAKCICKDIACFYNGINNEIEDLIQNPSKSEINEHPSPDIFL